MPACLRTIIIIIVIITKTRRRDDNKSNTVDFYSALSLVGARHALKAEQANFLQVQTMVRCR